MTKERKETISFGAAIGMLMFGVILTTAGFLMPPPGEIHDSVLYVLGQCLLFAGGVMGVSAYTTGRMRHIEHSVKRDIDARFRAYEAGRTGVPEDTGDDLPIDEEEDYDEN